MEETYRLPLKNKILYSFGQLGVTVPTFFISTYIFIFYAPLKGQILSASVVGAAFFLGTLIQALANPLIGDWSDKLTHKLGRRRFFIATGFVPLAILFMVIWLPIFHGIAAAVSLFIYMVGFNFLYAYVVLPYLALIPEISVESTDRVRLTTISAYFSIFGIILSSVVPIVMFALNFSYSNVGFVMALIVLIAFLIVFLSTKETETQRKMPLEYSLFNAFVQTFRNKTFNRYIVAYLFFQFGFYFFLSSLGYYVNEIVMPGNPDYKTYVGVFTLIAVISAVIFSPLLVRYTDRKGEKRSFIMFTFLLGIAMLFTFFLGFNQGISNLDQMIILMVFSGIGLTSYFILPNSIISEIIDEDELITGYRREAMYFGVQGLLERVPSALAGLALGFWITDLFQATGNVIFIRLLGVIGGSSTIITAILFMFVPLKQGIRKEVIARNEQS